METKSRSPLYLACRTPASKDAAPIGAHIFDTVKNMKSIFEIITINKQNELAKFYRGEIHQLVIL
jgi:hypothetical protein